MTIKKPALRRHLDEIDCLYALDPKNRHCLLVLIKPVQNDRSRILLVRRHNNSDRHAVRSDRLEALLIVNCDHLVNPLGLVASSSRHPLRSLLASTLLSPQRSSSILALSPRRCACAASVIIAASIASCSIMSNPSRVPALASA